jgi:chromosome partitioning protein
MRVVSIVNQKGGCGKTTTAVNLAAVLARGGSRVLLVDMDPQSHCAAGLGVPEQTLERTIADAMLADHARPPRADEYLWEVSHGLRLLPSSVTLAALEAPNGPLAARFDRDRRLARVLAAWQDDFDWCVIDCPPTIGLLTYNALRASDLVVVPVETGFFSLKGAEKQIETIGAVVRRFGREIPFRLLPTLYNASRALSRDVVVALERRFPDALLPVVVREHEELRDAASYGQSIIEFAPGSEAEADFLALAAWLQSNAPAATALAEHAGMPGPIIETSAEAGRDMLAGRGISTQERELLSGGGVAAVAAPDESPLGANTRASDLVSRLRAFADRSRQQSPMGGGFGVRLTRDGTVVFSQPASAHALFVVGDFNGWNPIATPMMASADGLRMEAVVDLAPGRHAYRIVVDGVEQVDAFNPHRDPEREGPGSSLVEVPAATQAMASAAIEGGVR